MVQQRPREHEKSITGICYRHSVLPEVIVCYKKAQPHAGTRGIKLQHDSAAPAHTESPYRNTLSEETIETLPNAHYVPGVAPRVVFRLCSRTLKQTNKQRNKYLLVAIYTPGLSLDQRLSRVWTIHQKKKKANERGVA